MVDVVNNILDASKVEKIKIIDIHHKTSVADYFVIATCRSTRHASATADELIKKLKQIGITCSKPEGRPKCDWVIVDAASVVIHLFRSEIRELYNLEKLWNMSIDPVEIKLA